MAKGKKCLFAAESPEVEIRGGLVFIRPIGSHGEIATTPFAARVFAKRVGDALDAYEAANAQVVLFRQEYTGP